MKPLVKTIEVWPAGVDAVLQDWFKNTDWAGACLRLRPPVALKFTSTLTHTQYWNTSTPQLTMLPQKSRLQCTQSENMDEQESMASTKGPLMPSDQVVFRPTVRPGQI